MLIKQTSFCSQHKAGIFLCHFKGLASCLDYFFSDLTEHLKCYKKKLSGLLGILFYTPTSKISQADCEQVKISGIFNLITSVSFNGSGLIAAIGLTQP